MGRTACTEPQCLYKGALYLYFSLVEVYQCFAEAYCLRIVKVKVKVTL